MTHRIQNPKLSFREAKVRRTITQGIVLHHIAGQMSVQQIHELHRKNGWNGIGYNFVVDFDGTIREGRGMNFIGAHTQAHNARTVGIAVNGCYHTQRTYMPDAQFNALVWLIREIRAEYGNLPIHAHHDLAPTTCPGRYFPLEDVRKGVARPLVPPKTTIPLHTVKEGDTLWSIARTHLGRGALWHDIFDLNRDIVDDPDVLVVGTALQLPYS